MEGWRKAKIFLAFLQHQNICVWVCILFVLFQCQTDHFILCTYLSRVILTNNSSKNIYFIVLVFLKFLIYILCSWSITYALQLYMYAFHCRGILKTTPLQFITNQSKPYFIVYRSKPYCSIWHLQHVQKFVKKYQIDHENVLHTSKSWTKEAFIYDSCMGAKLFGRKTIYVH